MARRARFALAMIAGQLVGAPAARAVEPARRSTVHVAGEGRAVVTPDVAVAFVGVEVQAQDVTAAIADASDRMRRVLEALAASGVAKKDVQTSRYDVGIDRRPDPRGGPGQVSGYRVANEVRVTIRDLARAGRVLDAAAKAGANTTRSLAFQKEDTSAERNRALALAMADARAKAEVLVRAAGRELGEVLEISEGAGLRSLPALGIRSMAAPSEVPLEAGELQLSTRVEVEYAIR